MPPGRIVSIWMALCVLPWASALVTVTPTGTSTSTATSSSRSAMRPSSSSSIFTALKAHPTKNHRKAGVASTFIVATTVWIASSFPPPVYAYDTSDYASETVQEVLQSLQTSSGNEEATFKTFETIAGIITEGKGVGGMVNYKGVQLERGFVSDEDTSIYNPGLTLLTESEKERLVEAIIENRKVGLSGGQWSENNEFAYEFLKGRLDPLHMYELSGFLTFVPAYGALVYLVVLAIQQNVRSQFTPAYIGGVVAFFAPIVALVAAGPQ